MAYRFSRTTYFEADPATVFDASLDVDFHKASFAETGEEIVGGITSGSMALDDTVTWKAKHFGLWWEMTTKISSYDRPRFFVDEQVDGPFKTYCHEHHFAADRGGTAMRDVVEFAAPLGPLGIIAERLALRRHMEALIDLRNLQLGDHLATITED